MSKSKKFALGTLFAAVAGYIAGVLTAPKSGRETRADIKTAAHTAWSEGEKQLKRAHTELNDLINQTRERTLKLKGAAQKQYDEAVDAAQQAKDKARLILSALHEGETDDKDLKKAIAEAQKAAEHLRAYLAKKVDKVENA